MTSKDFSVGRSYYTRSLVGAASDTRYKCVHVGEELLVFVYEYQGRERVHSVYLKEIKPETFVQRQMTLNVKGA